MSTNNNPQNRVALSWEKFARPLLTSLLSKEPVDVITSVITGGTGDHTANVDELGEKSATWKLVVVTQLHLTVTAVPKATFSREGSSRIDRSANT